MSSITEPIEQPGTDASVASNSALVPRNETPSVPALHVISYKALIWVMPPPKKSSTRRKKVMKTDPVTYGPADFASDSIWDQFLTQLASTVDSLASLLALPSLEWRWQTHCGFLFGVRVGMLLFFGNCVTQGVPLVLSFEWMLHLLPCPPQLLRL